MFDGVIIKAAGTATRLKPLSDYCPKPFLKYHKKQLIEYQYSLIKKNNIENVLLSTKLNFLPFLLDSSDKYKWKNFTIFINDQETNGAFLEHFFINKIKGLWLVLCSDIITDIDLESLYNLAKSKDFTFAVTPMKSNVNATHKIKFDKDQWAFDAMGTHILSGISIINFDNLDYSLYVNFDFENMWKIASQNNQLSYFEIMPDYWKSFDYIQDFLDKT